MYAHRITGRHLFVRESGAIIWLDSAEHVTEIVERVKQGGEQLNIPVIPRVHEHDTGVAIAIDFPVDILYTACELLEWAASPDLFFDVVFPGATTNNMPPPRFARKLCTAVISPIDSLLFT